MSWETLEQSLLGSAEWLREHRAYVNKQVHEGYDAIIDSIQAGGQRALELEVLCQEARDLIDGTWCPEEADRVKFMNRLKEVTGESE